MSGRNERMVATRLGAKRKSIFLAIKCDASTRAGVLAKLETSLKELNDVSGMSPIVHCHPY
jgi:hypothetical protein